MSNKLRAGVVVGSALAMLAFSSLAFAAGPAVSVSGGNTPLSQLSVSGLGFQASEPVHLSLGLSSADTHADANGSFAGVPMTIPNVQSGLYLVIAVGQNSGQVAFSYLYVQALNPMVSPSSWYIQPGATLSWTGSGYAPNEVVSVSQNGSQIASFNADSNGNFTAMGGVPVPFSAHGSTQTYVVHG